MGQLQINFRNIVVALPGQVAVLNAQLAIVAASEGFLKAYGLKADEAEGTSCLAVVPGKNAAAKVKDSITYVLTRNVVHKVVLHAGEWSNALNNERNGTELFIEHRPVIDASGKVGHVVQHLQVMQPVSPGSPGRSLPDLGLTPFGAGGSIKPEYHEQPDISAFHLPINSLPIGIWLLDAGGTIVYANDAAKKIWGGSKYVSQEQFGIYKAWWYATGEPVQPGEFAAVRALEKGEPVFNDELKIQGFKGEWRVIRNTAVPLTGKNGERTGVMVVNEDITEQKKADDARRASEKKFMAIFENSMDSVLLTHPDGSIAMVNAITAELFGYTREELLKLDRAAVLDMKDPHLAAALEERKKSGHIRCELTGIRKDGTRFPVEVSSAVFKDDKDEEWTSMFIREITERKKVEKDFEDLLNTVDEKKRWLEAVIDRAPMGILLIQGGEKSSILPNSWAQELFGNEIDWHNGLDAVIGIVCDPAKGKALGFEELATSRAMKGETTSGMEQLLCFKDGRKIPVLVNSGPIRNAEGEIIGAVTIFQDISAQKKVERDLKQAVKQLNTEKHWLNTVFESAPLGIILVKPENPDQPIPNAYARRVIGSMIEWSKGRGAYVGIAHSSKGKKLSKSELVSSRILKGQTVEAEEQLLRLADGREIPILAAGAPILDEQGNNLGAVAFFQDITSMKELERLREEWSAVIAHDLRQPITSIKLQAALLKMLPDVSAKQKRIAEIIETNANQLNRMTNDLLEAAQLESQKLKIDKREADIGNFVSQVVERLQPLFPKNKIVVSAPPSIPMIEIDPGRIEQVIGNLVSNASKYGLPECEISIELATQTDSLSIKVTNPGKGIEAKDMVKLFQRFNRTTSAKKGKVKGIGLGLYIAKGLVEAHAGRLYVESIPGEFTSFTIELPIGMKEGD